MSTVRGGAADFFERGGRKCHDFKDDKEHHTTQKDGSQASLNALAQGWGGCKHGFGRHRKID